jgi:O-antigen/teichoic acid export membrane protein
VDNAATTATIANTANSIVLRDVNGAFSAGSISASLNGNAATATRLATARSVYGNTFDGTADLTQIYAIFPFLNILFTYGVETSFFRFIQNHPKQKLFNTLNVSIFVSTILLTCMMLLFKEPLIEFTAMQDHPEFITWMAMIVFFDTLSALPFAKLRQEERPRKYAFIKLLGIIINVLIVIWYIGVCPNIAAKNPTSILLLGYHESIGIGYYLIGNIIGSILTFALLLPEYKAFKFEFDSKLWKEVMKYSYPLIIVGLGGMINDMLSRLVFQHVTDLPVAEAKKQLGIFAANYRLAVLITIFIQNLFSYCIWIFKFIL